MYISNKSRFLYISLLAAAFTVAGCGTISSPLPQVDWSSGEPIAAGGTETVVEGLNHPWSLAWLPDGGFLVTERGGQLLYFEDYESEPVQVAGVPTVFAEGQGGLLDIALHPNFQQNRFVYLSYSAGDRRANRTEVARFVFVDQQLESGEVVFAVNEYKSGTQHFGSRLLFLPDGTLLVSVGDGGNPPIMFEGRLQRRQAQNEETLFGNLVRINDNGSIPEDNPFLDVEDARPELYTIGHRNVQGLARDETTGTVWVTEHGSRGGDEINRIVPGENYGWPLVSHSREYVRGTPVSRHQTLEGYRDPTLVWMETVAPSGLAVRDGVLYAGGLRSQALHLVHVSDTGEFERHSYLPIGARVRAVSFDPQGEMYLLTDEAETGRLIRVLFE
jgi:glucose/arabinose dehydrogenase